MTKRKITGSLMLMLTAFIWGCAFIAQSTGMEHIGPFEFNSVRFLLGAVVLLPFIILRDRKKQKADREERIYFLKTGLSCGMVLAVATIVQQYGIIYTTVGKASFITSLYVLIVPCFGLFYHKRPGKLLILCVALAVAGLYLLTLADVSSINKGDIFALASAFLFSVQITMIERKAQNIDGVKLSALQFAVAGILLGIATPFFETVSFQAILDAKIEILYTGVLSCGIAYTFQILGQQRIEGSVASLIMSLECVFAALMGAIILKQTLTARELTGCALMLAAIMAAQLFLKEKVCD